MQYKDELCSLYNHGRGSFFYCEWNVYPSGLGISIIGHGTVYIPVEDFLKLDKYVALQEYYLEVDSQEVRLSKIAIPNDLVFSSLEKIYKKNNSV